MRKHVEIDTYSYPEELALENEEYMTRVLDEYNIVKILHSDYQNDNSIVNCQVIRSEDIIKLDAEVKVLETAFQSKYSFAESIFTSTVKLHKIECLIGPVSLCMDSLCVLNASMVNRPKFSLFGTRHLVSYCHARYETTTRRYT